MAGNTQTYVHEINGLPIAASEVVPGSALRTELDSKADLPQGTKGNLAGFDANGDLVDSGITGDNVLQSAIMVLNDSSGVPGKKDLVNPNDSTQVYIEEMTNQQIDDLIDALA